MGLKNLYFNYVDRRDKILCTLGIPGESHISKSRSLVTKENKKMTYISKIWIVSGLQNRFWINRNTKYD